MTALLLQEDATPFFIELLDNLSNLTGIPYVVTRLEHNQLRHSGRVGLVRRKPTRRTLEQRNASVSSSPRLRHNHRMGLFQNADLLASDFVLTSARQKIFDYLIPLQETVIETLVNTAFGTTASGLQLHHPKQSRYCLFAGKKRSDFRAFIGRQISKRFFEFRIHLMRLCKPLPPALTLVGQGLSSRTTIKVVRTLSPKC